MGKYVQVSFFLSAPDGKMSIIFHTNVENLCSWWKQERVVVKSVNPMECSDSPMMLSVSTFFATVGNPSALVKSQQTIGATQG